MLVQRMLNMYTLSIAATLLGDICECFTITSNNFKAIEHVFTAHTHSTKHRKSGLTLPCKPIYKQHLQ